MEDVSSHPLLRPHRKATDDRYYRLAEARSRWQAVALLSLGLAIALAVGFTLYALQGRDRFVVLEVNRLGLVRTTGPLSERQITPDVRQAVKEAKAAEFVAYARTVFSDREAQTFLLRVAYDIAGPDADRFLNVQYRRRGQDPRVLALRLRRTVEIESITLVPDSDDTFNVKWTETVTPLRNGPIEISRWDGMIKVEHVPPDEPASEEGNPVWFNNPLDFRVTQANWNALLVREEEPDRRF